MSRVIITSSARFKKFLKERESIARAIDWRDETPAEVWKPIVQACIESFDSPPELGELSLRLAAWDYKMPERGKA
jgi:hypothetical protein